MDFMSISYNDPKLRVMKTFNSADSSVPAFGIVVQDKTFSLIVGVNENGTAGPLDKGFSLESEGGGKAERTIANLFVVIWSDNYQLFWNGEVILKLNSSRTQEIVFQGNFIEDQTKRRMEDKRLKITNESKKNLDYLHT